MGVDKSLIVIVWFLTVISGVLLLLRTTTPVHLCLGFIYYPVFSKFLFHSIQQSSFQNGQSRLTLYTAGHLHAALPHCWHSCAPIVHTAVPQENNEHGLVYLRCSVQAARLCRGSPVQCPANFYAIYINKCAAQLTSPLMIPCMFQSFVDYFVGEGSGILW